MCGRKKLRVGVLRGLTKEGNALARSQSPESVKVKKKVGAHQVG
jgi:hypothetical protein